MFEYVLYFVILFVGSIGFNMLYERFIKNRKRPDTSSYIEALKDLLDGRQESAFTKLRQVVSEDSSNIDAYLRLGQILREHKRPDRAVQVHKDLTLRTGLPVSEKSKILKQLALDYIELQDFDMAQAALKELISVNPQNKWAFQNLLKIHDNNKQWDEAYETATQLLKLESNKSKKPLAQFKYHKAKALHDKREFHKARVLYKESLGLDPNYVDAYIAVGDSYISERRDEDAVNIWSKLIEKVPSAGHLVIDRLKKTLFDLGRFGDIVDICNSILKHSPNNIEAKLTLSEFYEKKGELDMAESFLNELMEDNPGNIRITLELIRLYLEKNDTRKIKELIKIFDRKKENLPTAVSESDIINTG